MTKEFHHVTVLLHETIDMLDVKPDGIYVDATLGGAGHSEYLLSKLSEKGISMLLTRTRMPLTMRKTVGTLYRKGDGNLYQG